MKTKMPLRYIEILVVEDNNADVRLIKEYFKDDRMVYHNINVVNNGIEALKFLRKEGIYSHAVTPDIVLLDLYMPRMNGNETLQAIRSESQFENLIVGIMSSNNLEDERLNIDVSGPTFYIIKPVDVDKFLELMHKAESYLDEDLRIFR